MKKTTTSNPLKFFNDAKEARNKSFNKSLPKKGDGGRTMGPMTQQEAAQAAFASSQNNAMTSGEGPRVYSNEDKIKQSMNQGMRPEDSYKSIKANIPSNPSPRIIPRPDKQLEMINREMINSIYTKPKTEIPVSPEYKPNEYEYINNKGAKNGGMMKKGGTHKMPNSKVMLNSKMKKVGVIKSKKK
jgi:hypothetical protein